MVNRRTKQSRIVVVHGLADAEAALGAAAALGVPVRLRSAPGAAAYAGAAWFQAAVAAARARAPAADAEAALDCGDRAGLALAALRQGLPLVRFTGARATAVKLAAIAARRGASLDTLRGPVLDLLDRPDAAAACRAWLAR